MPYLSKTLQKPLYDNYKYVKILYIVDDILSKDFLFRLFSYALQMILSLRELMLNCPSCDTYTTLNNRWKLVCAQYIGIKFIMNPSFLDNLFVCTLILTKLLIDSFTILFDVFARTSIG